MMGRCRLTRGRAGVMGAASRLLVLLVLAGCAFPGARSLDPWERASGEVDVVSSSEAQSLLDAQDGRASFSDDAPDDDSRLAPPSGLTAFPPGTNAYAPPGEFIKQRYKGYENTIAAQLEKALNAEFDDAVEGSAGGSKPKATRSGDGLGDSIDSSSDESIEESKFESKQREEGTKLERVVVTSGKGKGTAEVVVAKSTANDLAEEDEDEDDAGLLRAEHDAKTRMSDGESSTEEAEPEMDYAERLRRRRGGAAPPPPAPSDADKDDMKASARSFGREFDDDDSIKEDRGVEDHSATRDDSLDENKETHVSANNRAHGITIDEENESADDVRAAQHVAASERLAKAENFIKDVGHVIRDVDDVLTGKIIEKVSAKREEAIRDDGAGGTHGGTDTEATPSAEDAEQVLRIKDAKQNEFVVVSTKESAYQLSTDMRLVVDLIELFFAAACGAFVFVRLLGLPLHGGYVLAGIVIGPSGMNVVGEIVQITTLAHLGVLLPLFARGAELATRAKERRAESRAGESDESNARGFETGRVGLIGGTGMTLRGLVPKTKTFAGAFGPFGVACLFTALSPVLGFTPGVGALVGGLTAFSSSEMIRWGAKPPRGRRTHSGNASGSIHQIADADVASGMYRRATLTGDGGPGDVPSSAASIHIPVVPRAVSERIQLTDWSLGPVFVLLHAVAGVEDGFSGTLFVSLAAYKVRSTCLCLLITAVMTAFRSSLMRRAMRTPIENGGEELVQMGTVSTCLAAAFLSDWFGLGMEAGAFVGGVAVGAAFGKGEESRSGHHSEGADPGAEGADPGADTAVDTERKSVADVVGSFTRMFEAIQFVSVGVVLRPWYVVEHAYWLILVLTFLITVKTFTGGLVMHVLDGCPRGVSWVIGGCVANVSEFSFAIVNRAYLLGIVGKERYRPMLCLCVLSWLSAPVLNYRVVPWVLRGGRGRGRRR